MAGRSHLFVPLVLLISAVIAAACGPQSGPPPPSTPAPTTATQTTAAPTTAAPTTAAPTASPTPSPTAPPSVTLPPVLTSCPVLQGGSTNAQAQLVTIRTAHNPGFDRVVFEFGPSSVGSYALPPYQINATNGFMGTSGRQVPVDGNAFLSLRFSNASTVDPNTGKQTFTNTDIHPGLPLLRHVKLIDDFERVMTWGLGLERLSCPTITELASPVRLVVDLPTPP